MRMGLLDLGHFWEQVLGGRPISGASPHHGDQAVPGRESQPASPLQEANSKRADIDG